MDASVAAKWCLSPQWENYSAQAVELLASVTSGNTQVFVPDLFFAEMGNILWKAVRKQKISSNGAFAALHLLRELDLFVFPTADLTAQALEIALQHNRTVYDCLYVALAVRSSTDFITADEKLANALAAYLPVKWLGVF
ncbi:MAG TPA: type II toxin-antitoxin system VapC family toxin [Terriglobales bacterium]